MKIKSYIYCQDLRESFDFYRGIIPPFFEVDVYEPRKLMVVDFFFLVHLVVIEKPAPPSEMFFTMFL